MRPRNEMIGSISVRNFRSFNDAKVDDCRRINIVVGENGSGKTALLEAIFLAAGISPELALRTRNWRGYEGARMSGSPEDIHQALWADLFHKFQTARPALVALKGSKEQNRSVTVTLHPMGHVRVIPPSRKSPGVPVKVVPDKSPIEFKWKIQGHPDVTVAPALEGENLVFPPAPAVHVKASFFAANRVPPSVETANRFSLLSRAFRDQEFVREFSRLYPYVKNLSVEMTAGAAMLFAEVDSLPEKIPLSLTSGGMSKLAAILLSMSCQAGGVMLIDEVENGFYHRRLPDVWKSLLHFARAYDCQLFASTHSAECLEAAAAIAEESPDEFAVIRTVHEQGETRIRHFGGDKFVDAMVENIEIR